MAKVTIMLAPQEVMRVFFFNKDHFDLVKQNLSKYSVAGTYEWPMSGEEAAEEAFDLTNNPSREDERLEEYGHGRSVSTGDVVEVDGVKYVCLSFGWGVL